LELCRERSFGRPTHVLLARRRERVRKGTARGGDRLSIEKKLDGRGKISTVDVLLRGEGRAALDVGVRGRRLQCSFTMGNFEKIGIVPHHREEEVTYQENDTKTKRGKVCMSSKFRGQRF